MNSPSSSISAPLGSDGLLKRGLVGTYISVEPFHLFRYVDEQAFRSIIAAMPWATQAGSTGRCATLSDAG
jgi:hypothetical protein